jgi:methyl-accepting chemotaxis protein
LLAEIDVEEALGPVDTLNNYMLVVVVVAVLVIAVLALHLGRMLAAPIQHLSATLKQITSSVDLSLRIDNHHHDEVGQTAADINNLLVALGSCFAEVKDVLTGVSESDFSRCLEKNYQGDMKDLSNGMNQTVSQLEAMKVEQ